MGVNTRSYTPSRHYPHGRAKHPEARYVVDRRAILEIVPPGVREALGSRASNSEGGVDLGGAWLGRVVGKGVYGTVYLTTANPTLLALPPKLSYGFVRAMPRRGVPVIVKVMSFDALDPMRELKENAVHDQLSTASCVYMGPDVSKGLCIAPHVPKLCFCGAVPGTSSKYLTVMTLAPGRTLWDELASGLRVTAELYVRFERLLAALWANGVVHNDLHMQNVMYDPASGHLTVIDFGYAALLPPDLAARVKAALVKGVELGVRSLGELWRPPARSPIGTDLQSYANRAAYTRSRNRSSKIWYNPEGGTLLRLYSRLSAAERAAVPALRRRVWGYKLSVAANTLSPLSSVARTESSSVSDQTSSAFKKRERSTWSRSPNSARHSRSYSDDLGFPLTATPSADNQATKKKSPSRSPSSAHRRKMVRLAVAILGDRLRFVGSPAPPKKRKRSSSSGRI